MPTAAEASGTQSQLEAALDAGLDAISAFETIIFTRYQKWTLSIDGSVYWLATGERMTAQGSLHYATDRHQDEASTESSNQVIFSSESEVTQFNIVEPDSMWLGSWPIPASPPLKVAFSQRGNYFVQADIWHYSGIAVLPPMETQIIATATDLPSGPIVSNSLPIWLSYNAIAPVYSSFLVPDNAAPPYVAVHIESTESLAAAPTIGPWPGVTLPNSGASPLHELPISIFARDRVKLTTYGFSNQMVWQYLAYLEGGVGFGRTLRVRELSDPDRREADAG